MTAPDLSAIEALLAKATPGPWKVIGAHGTALWAGDSIIANHSLPRKMHQLARADAEAVVAAVNAMPSLIARVRELEQQVQACGIRPRGKSVMQEAIAAAIAMRERCSEACDDLRTDDIIVSAWEAGRQAAIAECAAAIRALEP